MTLKREMTLGRLLQRLGAELQSLIRQSLSSLVAVQGTNRAGPGEQDIGSGFVVHVPSPLIGARMHEIGVEAIVLTNHHVVADLPYQPGVTLRTPRRELIKAAVLGSDPVSDVAVLATEHGHGLDPMEFRDEPVVLGELVLALGSPLGMRETVSLGIVSGVGRALGGYRRPVSAFQVDAAINPGNSGGPVLDVEGRVVGIATAGIPGAENVGFAVSGGVAARVCEEIILHGTVQRGSLGISVREEVVADTACLRVTRIRERISDRKDGRFEPEDLIVSIDGNAVRSRGDLYETLDRMSIGRMMSIVVIRDGRERTLRVSPIKWHPTST